MCLLHNFLTQIVNCECKLGGCFFHYYSYSVKDEGRKRGGEEELTERGSGADGGLSSQIDSASQHCFITVYNTLFCFKVLDFIMIHSYMFIQSLSVQRTICLAR